ncbi:MAG: DUF91 domain-containing protein [Deltaproteobacteria bacterium]|jgi:endonuclease|nr:DUF91 domain-containing protein [Deltaproteobacteria bacterium]
MAIYDKPVRVLMKEDMVKAFHLEPGKQFSKAQAVNWFGEQYPDVKKGTVIAHLVRLSINARSRVHYKPKPVEDDVFFQIDGGHFRLYEPGQDPQPIQNATTEKHSERLEVEEEAEPVGMSEFAYERDLQNYLVKNLELIEPGLKLYEDDGINGIEFPVGGRFIDILAVDSKGDFVVIELKVARGYDRVVGQLLRYIAWIKKEQTDPGQNVRGIIIARDISEDLLLACSSLTSIELFEYELSLALKLVQSCED